LTLSGVRTAIFAGGVEGMRLQVLTSLGDVIDEAALPHINISAGNLTHVNVSAPALRAFSYNDFTISFRSGPVGLPAGSDVVVTFPFEVEP